METTYEAKDLIKMLIIILLICAAFYGLTVLITSKTKNNSNSKVNNSNTQIKYDEIMIGNIFEQNEDKYYVIAYKSEDYLTLQTAVSNYNKKSDNIKVYISDLESAFNKKYYSQKSNYDNKYPILSTSTLLIIENNAIVEHIEGIESIQKKLG